MFQITGEDPASFFYVKKLEGVFGLCLFTLPTIPSVVYNSLQIFKIKASSVKVFTVKFFYFVFLALLCKSLEPKVLQNDPKIAWAEQTDVIWIVHLESVLKITEDISW